MLPDIDYSRNELRFLVPREQKLLLFTNLESITGKSFVGDPPRNTTLVQSFYFGQNGYLPKNTIIRLRRYNQTPTNVVRLDYNDLCVLEIKSSPDSAVNQWKERENVIAISVLANLMNPRRILDSIKTLRPYVKSTTKITAETFYKLMGELKIGESLELLLATECFRTHFEFSQKNLKIRITVDVNQRYFGFLGSLEGSSIGADQNLKVEIKFPSDSIEEDTTSIIKRAFKGIGAVKIDSKKTHIQDLYTSFRSLSTKTDTATLNKDDFYLNEFPGEELELKFMLNGMNFSSFINSFRELVLKGRIKDFGELPSLSDIKTQVFDMETFGVSNTSGKREHAFILIHPSKDKLYRCKTKSAGIPLSWRYKGLAKLITRRGESKVGAFESQAELIESFSRKYNQIPVSAGRFKRTKKFFYITNERTHRNYCVSADLCASEKGNSLSQIEIEYKGKVDTTKISSKRDIEVITDFNSIASAVTRYFKGYTRPTRLTKFEWLVELNNGE